MALKKVEEEVKTTVNVQNETKDEPITPEVEVTVEVPEVEVPEVEVEEPKADIEVDADKAEVKANNRPNGNVKIRMRVDHKCCIAMERYDLKAGKTYVVPENVKRILNKAGLLAPL